MIKKILLLIIILTGYIYSQGISLPTSLLSFSTPEQYRGSVDSAISQRNGKPVLLRSDYTVTRRLSYDGSSTGDIEIWGTKGSSITFTASPTDSNGYYNDTTGHITFKNFDKVKIHGVKLIFPNSDSVAITEYNDNGLIVKTCNDVDIQYNHFIGANYAGVYLNGIKKLIFNYNKIDSCLYAGTMVRETGTDTINSEIAFNSWHHNGFVRWTPSYYPFGYGLALATMWGTDSTKGNRNIKIHDNTISESFRTAISGHNGINVKYYNNYIYRFGMSALSPINETGAPGYESFNQDIVIGDNIVVFDSAWCKNNYLGINSNYPIRPIWAGAYDDSTNAIVNNNPLHFPTGIVEIMNNKLFNMSMSGSYFYAPIIINTNRDYSATWYDTTTGHWGTPLNGTSKISNIKVKGNIITGIYNPVYSAGIIITGTDYRRRDNPENNDISDNIILGKNANWGGGYGIIIADGKSTKVSGNQIGAGFVYSILGQVPYTGVNNRLDSVKVADITPFRSYDSYFKKSGKAEYNISTNNVTDSTGIRLARIDTRTSESGFGGTIFDVKISAVDYFPSRTSTFYGMPSIGREYTYSFIAIGDTMSINLQTNRVFSTPLKKPKLMWMKAGSDSMVYLTAILPNTYMDYKIEMNFHGNIPVFITDSVDVDTLGMWGIVHAGTHFSTYNKTTKFRSQASDPYTNTLRKSLYDLEDSSYYADGNIDMSGYGILGADTTISDVAIINTRMGINTNPVGTLRLYIDGSMGLQRSYDVMYSNNYDLSATGTDITIGNINTTEDIILGANLTSGNVGIGTTSPTEKLEVNGSVKTMQLYSTPIQLSDQTPTTADCDSSNTFYVILSEDLQIDLDNMMSGQIINIWITNDATPWVVTWTQTIKWLGGVAPVISTSSTDCITIELVGSTYYGAYSQNYATP